MITKGKPKENKRKGKRRNRSRIRVRCSPRSSRISFPLFSPFLSGPSPSIWARLFFPLDKEAYLLSSFDASLRTSPQVLFNLEDLSSLFFFSTRIRQHLVYGEQTCSGVRAVRFAFSISTVCRAVFWTSSCRPDFCCCHYSLHPSVGGSSDSPIHAANRRSSHSYRRQYFGLQHASARLRSEPATVRCALTRVPGLPRSPASIPSRAEHTSRRRGRYGSSSKSVYEHHPQ